MHTKYFGTKSKKNEEKIEGSSWVVNPVNLGLFFLE